MDTSLGARPGTVKENSNLPTPAARAFAVGEVQLGVTTHRYCEVD